MKKARYRTDYLLGYRTSSGTQDLSFSNGAYAENYYALALCVYENFPSGRALYTMGISPERETSYVVVDSTYKNISTIAYALNKICGMQQKVVAPLLHVSNTTLRKALNYAGGEIIACSKTKLESKCPAT